MPTIETVFDLENCVQAQMGMGASQGMFDAKTAYASECTSLNIAPHTWVGETVEQRLLGDSYPLPGLLDMPTTSSSGSVPAVNSSSNGSSSSSKKANSSGFGKKNKKGN
jgi:hypothetical protein